MQPTRRRNASIYAVRATAVRTTAVRATAVVMLGLGALALAGCDPSATGAGEDPDPSTATPAVESRDGSTGRADGVSGRGDPTDRSGPGATSDGSAPPVGIGSDDRTPSAPNPGADRTRAVGDRRASTLHMPLVAQGPGPDRTREARLPDGGSAAGSGAATTGDPASCAGIVQHDGDRFVLDGQPFFFFGINTHYVLDEEFPEERVEPIVAHLAGSGANALRVWYRSDHDAERFARLLDLGAKYGVRFVVALGDNVHKGRDWLGSEDDEDDFRPHLRDAGARFGHRPEILMWEVINEPNCGGGYDAECLDAIKGWLRSRADELDAVDRCHLITSGMIGAGNFEEEHTWYRRIHQHETIDVLSIHKRTGEDRRTELEIAEDLEQPIFLGEVYDAAYDGNCSPLDDGSEIGRRVERVLDDLREAIDEGFDGYMLWAHAEGSVERPNGTVKHYCGRYDYERSDPIWDAIREADDLPPPVPWRAR